MSPAPRRPINRGLERNVYPHPESGYRWRHPVTKKDVYLGKHCTREEANNTARELNSRYTPKTSIFDKVVGASSTSLRSLIATHRKEFLSSQNLAAKTLEIYEYYLKLIEQKIGSWDVQATTTYDLAQFLKTASTGARARQLFRQMLIALFDTAVEEGLTQDNPARATRKPTSSKRRQRLTLHQYERIYDLAPQYLKNAMDLGLITLQRREDLVALRRDADTGDRLRVQQKKTGRRLAIEVCSRLREVLNRCSDGVASPFILHRLPERLKAAEDRAAARVHHTQILPEQITRAFETARDATGLFQCLPADQDPPSFHEIRSLGMDLYRKAGWPQERIQLLAGHENPEMTRHYLEGRERPWEAVPTTQQPAPRSVADVLF